MAPHSSTLAWKIPWTKEPGRQQSMRSLGVDFTFTFHFHALEKAMAPHSSIVAWRIPGTEEPGGLLSVGSHRVRHDWSDLAAAAAAVNSGTIPSRKELCWNRMIIVIMMKANAYSTYSLYGIILSPWTYLLILTTIQRYSYHCYDQFPGGNMKHREVAWLWPCSKSQQGVEIKFEPKWSGSKSVILNHYHSWRRKCILHILNVQQCSFEFFRSWRDNLIFFLTSSLMKRQRISL